MAVHVRRGYAVLQALLLVLAAVGTTLTIAGPVAAAAEDLTVTNEGQKLQPRGNLTFEVTDDLGVEDGDVHVWIDTKPNGEFDPGERNTSFDSSNGETHDGTFPVVDLPPGEYSIMGVENGSLNGGEGSQTRANFSVDDNPPGLAGAVAFTETNGTQAYGAVGRTVVEVLFNESLSDGSGGTAPGRGDLWIRLTDGTVLRDVNLSDGGAGDAAGDRRVVVTLATGLHPADIDGVATSKAANFTDQAGNPVPFHDHDVRAATTTVAESGENTSAFQGEIVAVVGDQDDEEVFMRSSSGDTIVDNTTGTDSKVYAWSSDGWPTAWNYRVFFDGRTDPNFLLPEDVGLELSDLELAVAPTKAEFSTRDDVTATIAANASNRTLTTTLVDSSGTAVASIAGSLHGKTARVNFGPGAEGEYRIEVEDNATGLEATTRRFRVREPVPSPTSTPGRTPTATPPLNPTATAVPTPTETVTEPPSGFRTPVRTPFPIETLRPTPTATPTASPGPATPTGTTPVPTRAPSAGVGGILQAVMDGIDAAVEAIADAFSSLLP